MESKSESNPGNLQCSGGRKDFIFLIFHFLMGHQYFGKYFIMNQPTSAKIKGMDGRPAVHPLDTIRYY